jgi:hypothetical protein
LQLSVCSPLFLAFEPPPKHKGPSRQAGTNPGAHPETSFLRAQSRCQPCHHSSACAMQRCWAAGSALRASGLWHTQRKWATMQTRGAKSGSRAGGGDQFSRLKVSDLKELLRAAGAQVSGTKSELQARIESICNENLGVSTAERLRLSGLKTAAVGPKGSSHSDTMLKSALDKAKSVIQRTRPDIASLAANTAEGQVGDDLAGQPGLHAEDDAHARAQEQPAGQEQAGAHSDVQCDDDFGGSYFRDSSGPSRPVESRAPASDDWDSLVINAQPSEGMSRWDRSNDMGGNAPPQKTGSRTEILPPLFELSKLTPQERKRLVDKVLHSQMRSLYRYVVFVPLLCAWLPVAARRAKTYRETLHQTSQ